jgi:hypothetical protein
MRKPGTAVPGREITEIAESRRDGIVAAFLALTEREYA